MVFGKNPPRYVVHRIPGPQTTSGPGDTVIDNYGQSYQLVDEYEAQSIRNSTGGSVSTLYPNGTIS